MKKDLNTKKLVKSLIATTVLTFGLMSGAPFAAASGLEKAQGEQTEPVKANTLHTSKKTSPENLSTPEVPAQSKGEVNTKKQDMAETKNAEPTPNEHASEKAASVVSAKPKVPAKPVVEEKAKDHLKKENKMMKSKASEHASETATVHANENSAVLANESTEESNESTQSTVSTEPTETDGTADYTFGSDSATTANPEGNDFYIGKLGYGSKVQFDTSTGGGIYFSSERAEEATYVYGYWFLSGMQIAPEGMSPIEWGEQQAQLALETYESMKSVYGSKVRPVIFIDVEPAYTGMKEYDFLNNQLIYEAFVDYLNQYGEGVKPGTYSSPWSWDITMGAYSPSTPDAYWVAYYPMDIPTDLTTSNSDWLEFPGTDEQAEIWQYYGGYDDYNVAWKLP